MAISMPLQAVIFGNFGTLYVEFSVVNPAVLQPLCKNTLAILQVDLDACSVDVSDENSDMPDYCDAAGIPETNSPEKIAAILWANILEWEKAGEPLSKNASSIIKHYYSAWFDVKKLEADIRDASNQKNANLVRFKKYLLSGTLGTTGVQKTFNDCEKDFYNLFA